MRFLFLSYLILVSCTTTIDPVFPYSGDKLVINGVLNNIDPVNIRLTHSEDPNGPVSSDFTITDGTVALYEDGIFLEMLSYDQITGKYFSSTNYVPIPGGKYHIEATAPGYKTATSASVTVPYSFSSAINSFQKVDSRSNPGTPAVDVFFNISDSVETVDYYAISIKGYIEELQEYIDMTSYSTPEGTLEVNSSCYFQTYETLVYNDFCLKGTFDGILEIELNEYIISSPDSVDFTDFVGYPAYQIQHVEISMQKVSQSYYEFVKNTSMEISDLENAFLEPPMNYTNIQNGYGVLAASNLKTYIINY